jgi:hypothetical protein
MSHTPVSRRYTGYQLPAYSQKIQTCAKMSDFQIDIELLISLIEARHLKDRDGTRKVWKEVCEGIKCGTEKNILLLLIIFCILFM